jgi:hypothetical protein
MQRLYSSRVSGLFKALSKKTKAVKEKAAAIGRLRPKEFYAISRSKDNEAAPQAYY